MMAFIDGIIESLTKIQIDLYEGDGKHNPSITARLALLEERMEKISSALSRITWIGVTALIAGLFNLLVGHVK